MDYTRQDQEVSKEVFIRRVAQAMVSAAISVMAEDPAAAGHAERATYARQVLSNPLAYAANFARGVATNPNFGTGVSDPLADDDPLAFVVASLWSAYAGYTPGTVGMAAMTTDAPKRIVAIRDTAPVLTAEAEEPKAENLDSDAESEPEKPAWRWPWKK